MQALTDSQCQMSQAAMSTGPAVSAGGFDSSAFCESLKEAFGKPRSWEAFDLESRLAAKRVTLAELYPTEHQPPTNAVRKLATKLKQLEKDYGYVPFVFVELREYLPVFCADFLPVEAKRDTEKEDLAAAKVSLRLAQYRGVRVRFLSGSEQTP